MRSKVYINVPRSSLEKVYDDVFNKFRTGDYERIAGRELVGENRRHLPEEEAHEATLHFMMWLWCEQHNLDYGRHYKMMIQPKDFPESELFQPNIGWAKPHDIVCFVSYETKRTRKPN